MISLRTVVLACVVLALPACEFLAPRSSCTDDRINGDETDVDCGGPTCPKCLAGQLCFAPADCASGQCTLARCVEPSCSDGVKNGAETDVDCGGTCGKCALGKTCAAAADCSSNACDAQHCVAASQPTCSDGVQNGQETGVDCGGPCTACPMASCTNAQRDGTETDVDCGGPNGCPRCAAMKACGGDQDCVSQVCNAGLCAAPCASPLIACDRMCVNPQTDRTHCGMCGRACAPTAACVAGMCEDPCPLGSLRCGGPACVDVIMSPVNCGQCNRTCAMTEVCLGGMCVNPCPQDLSPCPPNLCVNLASDDAHCGMCGRACSGGQSCVGGQCVATCGPLTNCATDGGLECADTQLDPEHCNTCGHVCTPLPNAAPMCQGGNCVRGPCLPPFDDCNTMAIDGCEAHLPDDDLHCGMCGHACAGGEHCVGGQCMSVCPPSLTNCATDGGVECTDTTSDPDHCNTCGGACPLLPNAIPMCQTSSCVLGPCLPPFDDCNAMPNDGCEAHLPDDDLNCGMCGRGCGGPETCVMGRCCGPLPPGMYGTTCFGCEACDGMLRCDCEDMAMMPHPTQLALSCAQPISNCNGVLTCGSCP